VLVASVSGSTLADREARQIHRLVRGALSTLAELGILTMDDGDVGLTVLGMLGASAIALSDADDAEIDS